MPISDKELEALQEMAGDLLKLTATQLDGAVAGKTLEEICDDCQTQGQESYHGGRP